MNASDLNIGPNIKKYRKSKGFTQQELADRSSISRSYLGDIEGGRYNPSIGTLEDIANALDVKVNSLIDSSSSNAVTIPVLGRIAAGIPLEAITDIIDYEEIPEKMARCGEYFALEVKGDSMEPKFSEGDVVIVRKQPTIESGEIAIVIVNNEDATMKVVKKHDTGIFLVSTNPNYEPRFFTNEEVVNLPVKILGKVVELRAKF